MKFPTLELEETEEGLPIPKRTFEQSKSLSKNGPRAERETWVDSNLFTHRELALDDTFTLSAFDMLEPLGLTKLTP